MVILISLIRLLLVIREHPLTLVSLIVVLTCIISVYLFKILSISWFSYTLVLIILGGIIVVFIYICRLTANEYVNVKPEHLLKHLPILLILFIISKTIVNKSLSVNTSITLEKIVFNRIITLFILLIIYLLVSLIVVVKITISTMGPLRRKKN